MGQKSGHAHVTREGTPQEDGHYCIQQKLEVETEHFSKGAENFTVNSGSHRNVYQTPAKSDESLVMKLTYGKTSALLEGDAEKRSERQIAEVLTAIHGERCLPDWTTRTS
jgi:beta-lactamase superfamily II metal-dependent hydrolase